MRPIEAAQLQQGMQVVTLAEGEVKREFVEERREITGDFQCYDFEVERLCNYFVGGVCVHNSIYAFRGSSPKYLLKFREEWPDASVVYLDTNYRSAPAIVAASRAVIVNNESRFEYEVHAARAADPSVPPPQIRRPLDAEAEAEQIGTAVEALHAGHGVPYSDMAILYRTHRLSQQLESTLRAKTIPHVVIGGMPFFARREIRDLLAWVALTVNPDDRVAFRRAVMAPPRGVGNATLDKFFRAVDEREGGYASITEAARGPDGYAIRRQQRESLRAFGRTVASMLAPADGPDLLERISVASGYVTFLRTQEDGQARIENVEELLALYRAFVPPDGARRPVAFLDWTAAAALAAGGRDKSDGPRPDAVSLMTMHGSKGTEFDTVFVVGCVDGVVPSFRSEDGEEERRLFYVAMTRARQRLVLSAPAVRRTAMGERVAAATSPFLHEAAEGGAEWEKR